MIVVLLLAVVGITVWVSRRGRDAVAPPAEIGAAGWAPGTRWSVVGPLARAESRRLLRHPAFLVGVVLTPLMFSAAWSAETSWWRISTGIALALVPLGWATIIATNLLALHPRRAGADELLAAAPAPQPVRSVALLLAAVPASAVAAVLAGGWVLWLGRRPDLAGSPQPLEIAAGVLLVTGSVAVGVAVARWLPHAGFGILAAVATVFLQARFFEVGSWPWYRPEADPVRFLGFLADPTSVTPPAFEVRPSAWHLVYLAGLVAVMAGVALTRDGVPRRLGAFLALGAVVVVGAGWVQLRPPTDTQVAAMAERLTDPVAHQTCTDDGPVRLCADPENRVRLDAWRARVAAVRALVPAAVAARPLVVADRVPTVTGDGNCAPQPFLLGLHPRVAALVTAARVWPDDGAVHPGTDRFPCGGRDTRGFFTAVQVAAWSVGLPPSPHHLDVRCTAPGQARSAVALWLGAAATPGGAGTLRALVAEETAASGLLRFTGWNDPPMWGVVFATSDAELALRLLALPRSRVAGELARAWETVVDPGTTSAELAGLLGVPSGARPGALAAPDLRTCA